MRCSEKVQSEAGLPMFPHWARLDCVFMEFVVFHSGVLRSLFDLGVRTVAKIAIGINLCRLAQRECFVSVQMNLHSLQVHLCFNLSAPLHF